MCGPLLDSSQLSKKIGLRLQGKSGILVCGVDGPPNCYFCWEGEKKCEFTKAETFQGKTELCVWVVLRGVRERGSAFFFLPLIHIPVLRAGVGFKSHEWRSRLCCRESDWPV